jgi:citrate synthase|tara:strand:+ start:1629 stop:2756 length:1128 start_codon:yes stop_codon:yes gene_type:complete
MNQTYSKGLQGVVVDETRISNVEGEIGRLTYRGYPIEELVKLPYERVIWLVLFDRFPDQDQEEQLARFLVAHMLLTDYERALLTRISAQTHPMVMLQSLVPLLDSSPLTDLPVPLMNDDVLKGLVIIAKLPLLIAAFHQLIEGNPFPDTDPSLSYHGNFLNLFNRKQASQEQVAILDVTQILQMEHSFNAGTFAGRVTASTLSPVECVISAAIGTLYGRLHGGADQAALEMAMDVGSPEAASAFVQQSLQEGRKIMGMGHREYRTADPRARILKPMAEKLNADPQFDLLLRTLEAIEAEFRHEMQKQQKDLWANVDYYKGLVFHALGIPPRFFTSLFAMSRTVGYLAHFMESRLDNRLMRPQALYTGREVTRLSA